MTNFYLKYKMLKRLYGFLVIFESTQMRLYFQ